MNDSNFTNSHGRFKFGENWTRFLNQMTDENIAIAEQSLKTMLAVDSLLKMHFLDVGSGSGLFSLAARRLGASVHSFDYDPQSVSCTTELKSRYFENDDKWSIERGSILDESYLSSLGMYDIVYSWGVLHHTGQMSIALDNIVRHVSPNGQLFIAIYNDQGLFSKYWFHVKRLYNRHIIFRCLLIALHSPYLLGLRWVARAFTGRFSLPRGMSLWHDMIDWLGGYPFEVAKPEVILSHLLSNGFYLVKLKTCGGRMGCNEFVFRRLRLIPE